MGACPSYGLSQPIDNPALVRRIKQLTKTIKTVEDVYIDTVPILGDVVKIRVTHESHRLHVDSIISQDVRCQELLASGAFWAVVTTDDDSLFDRRCL